VSGICDDPSNFILWGLDARRYVNLYGHDRILVLRALWQGVTSESLNDVPFLDLPALGGGLLLRGYAQDRFRDRQAGMASAEYQWMVDRNIAAFVFGDAGRVWRNRYDLDDGGIDAVRVGFGGGLQLHSMKNYLGRVLVSSSIDGDFFLLLSFDPLFETRRELKRK
jgi:outer membrane protein assembly factor BamA